MPSALAVVRVLACAIAFLLAAPAQSFNGRSAAEWVQDLAAEDVATRDYAVWALVTMGGRAVRATQRALADERPVVREHAAKTLGRLGPEAAAAKDRLVALQQDPVPAVAKAATVAALRVQVDAAQVPQLIAALQGGDWDLQLAAADVVAELGPAAKAAAPALVDLMRREDEALDRTVVQALEGTQRQYWNVRQSAARALGAIGTVEGVPIVAALGAVATNREWTAREGVAKALPRFAGDDSALALLFMLLLDEQWPVRRAAAEGMAEAVGPEHAFLPKVVEQMRRLLQDQDGGVRRLAAEFLGGCGAAAASAVPDLAQMLSSRSESNREYAIRALRGIGPAAASAKDALFACYQALPEDERWRQQEVLEALAAVAPDARRDIPALEAMLAEREQAVAAPEVKRHDTIVAALLELQDEDRDVRMRALGRLAQMRAVEAVASLLPWLEGDRAAEERAAAIHVLIALDSVPVEKMRELLESKQQAVRLAAAYALAMWDDTESLPGVAKVLTEGLAFANKDQLWQLGMTEVAALAPALEGIVANRKTTGMRRWGATQALGYLRQPTSGPVVAAMIEEVAADDAMSATDRDELLAVGLRVLVSLDPAPHRQIFTKYSNADEDPVRDAALSGLARLGDEAALAELRRRSPWQMLDLGLADDQRARFEATRLRLSQVKGCTLRDVLKLLEAKLGMRIEVSAKADPEVLDGRFGNYIDLIGFRPSALRILGAITFGTFGTFSGGTLVPRWHADRIELLTPEEVGLESGR